jgi:hypothetical protein
MQREPLTMTWFGRILAKLGMQRLLLGRRLFPHRWKFRGGNVLRKM